MKWRTTGSAEKSAVFLSAHGDAHLDAVAAELAKKDAALEIVGKAHALLELLSESAPPTFTPPPGAPHSKNSRR